MSSPDVFAALMGDLDYSLLIVTVREGDERSGCVVGFASQTSFDPPRFLVGISKRNHTHGVAARVEHLAVHLVPASERELATLFGGETGDVTDKFARCSWHEGPHGVPILDACPSWFVGRVIERVALGDHTGHLLEPVAAARGSDRALLSVRAMEDVEPGHEP